MPGREILQGARCRLEPLEAARHAESLHAAYAEDADAREWTYLPYGPFADAEAYREWVEGVEGRDDVIFFAILDAERGKPLGVASYLRIAPEVGSIEVGHLRFARALQRTATSTEAMYLMMRNVFDGLGYRRYEWKCDCLNAPSLAAARRLGFRFEGTFRNHLVTKGRNRDTSWLAITAEEWPEIRGGLEGWLDPSNFDDQGVQRRPLSELMPRP